MEKEIKYIEKENNQKLKIMICFAFIVLLVSLFVIASYSVSLKEELDNCNNQTNNSNNNNNNEIDSENNQNNEENNNEDSLTYDCSFTRTYNIVNTLDGYIAEVPELSYVVIDAFQDHSARTHIIPTKLKDGLKNNTTYEFTYTIKGTGLINEMQDIYNRIVSTTVYEEAEERYTHEPTLKVTLSIKETDKLGLSQLQEPICKGN